MSQIVVGQHRDGEGKRSITSANTSDAEECGENEKKLTKRAWNLQVAAKQWGCNRRKENWEQANEWWRQKGELEKRGQWKGEKVIGLCC